MILKQKIARAFAVAAVIFTGAMAVHGAPLNAGALVLVNSAAPDYGEFQSRLEPYLFQFGVPFQIRDISVHPLGAEIGNYSLLIIGHRGLDAPHRFLTPAGEHLILAAVRRGTGLVSFDGLLASWQCGAPEAIYDFAGEVFGRSFAPAVRAESITIDGAGGMARGGVG